MYRSYTDNKEFMLKNTHPKTIYLSIPTVVLWW